MTREEDGGADKGEEGEERLRESGDEEGDRAEDRDREGGEGDTVGQEGRVR